MSVELQLYEMKLFLVELQPPGILMLIKANKKGTLKFYKNANKIKNGISREEQNVPICTISTTKSSTS